MNDTVAMVSFSIAAKEHRKNNATILHCSLPLSYIATKSCRMEALLRADLDYVANVGTVQCAFAVVAAMAGIGLDVYIVTSSGRLSILFAPKNLLLNTMVFSGCGVLAAHAYFTFLVDGSMARMLTAFFAAIMEISYIWYCYLRSLGIFQNMSSPKVLFVLEYTLWTETALCLGPFISMLFKSTFAFNLTVAISGALLFALDTFFFVTFTMYVFRKTIQTIEVKGMEKLTLRMFQIIARYGLACSLSCLVVVVSFITSMYLLDFKPDARSEDIPVYYAFIILMDAGLLGMGFALMTMKAKLTNLNRSTV
ncbi:hypothetical protein BC830DRAFT_936447 [Chytriomyces sp. MP71]|nr:hypothetical protein BC830DRAFT_936447 [Chytriomyces sp. MP71]